MTSRNCSTGRYWLPGGGNERRLSLPSVMWFLWKERSAAISVSPQFPQNNLKLISVFESRGGGKSTVSVIVDVPVLWHNFQHLIYSFYHHLFKPLYLQLVKYATTHLTLGNASQSVWVSVCFYFFSFYFFKDLLVCQRCHSLTTRTLWEAGTAFCVNKDTLEKLQGFILQARRLTWTQHA